jgi:hypothetical protein
MLGVPPLPSIGCEFVIVSDCISLTGFGWRTPFDPAGPHGHPIWNSFRLLYICCATHIYVPALWPEIIRTGGDSVSRASQLSKGRGGPTHACNRNEMMSELTCAETKFPSSGIQQWWGSAREGTESWTSSTLCPLSAANAPSHLKTLNLYICSTHMRMGGRHGFKS